jgi:hypothetical protein
LFVLLSKKLARLVDFALEKQKTKQNKMLKKKKKFSPKKTTGIEFVKTFRHVLFFDELKVARNSKFRKVQTSKNVERNSLPQISIF